MGFIEVFNLKNGETQNLLILKNILNCKKQSVIEIIVFI